MKKLLLIPLLFASLAHAQAPANATLVGPEGIKVISTTGKSVVYEFGINGKFNVIPTLKLPALITCASNAPAGTCAALGGDPLPNTAKNFYAVQQATAFTVTFENAAGVTQPPVTIPALPPTSTTYLLTCQVVIPSGTPPATLPATGCTLVKQ